MICDAQLSLVAAYSGRKVSLKETEKVEHSAVLLLFLFTLDNKSDCEL